MAGRCPPGVVCIESVTLGLSLLVLVAAVVLVYGRMPRSAQKPMQVISPPPSITQVSIEPGVRQYPSCAVSGQPGNVFLNPYAAPLRDARLCGPLGPPGVPINVRTQGVEVQYRQVGLVTRVGGPETILPLMGRPLIPARDKWNFYTMASNQAQVKLPVRLKKRDCTSEYGCDDLTTGDLVEVDGYDALFRVRMYENSAPRYIPYL
jgi:hypothetical protein